MEETMDLMWMQTLTGGGDVIRRGIPVADALGVLQVEQVKALRGEYGGGVVVYLRPHAPPEAVIVAAEVAALRQAHADAWTLIGRCDMAFELIGEAKLLGVAKQTAKQLRAEIAKASGR